MIMKFIKNTLKATAEAIEGLFRLAVATVVIGGLLFVYITVAVIIFHILF